MSLMKSTLITSPRIYECRIWNQCTHRRKERKKNIMRKQMKNTVIVHWKPIRERITSWKTQGKIPFWHNSIEASVYIPTENVSHFVSFTWWMDLFPKLLFSYLYPLTLIKEAEWREAVMHRNDTSQSKIKIPGFCKWHWYFITCPC